jgi:hypothetical protein
MGNVSDVTKSMKLSEINVKSQLLYQIASNTVPQTDQNAFNVISVFMFKRENAKKDLYQKIVRNGTIRKFHAPNAKLSSF